MKRRSSISRPAQAPAKLSFWYRKGLLPRRLHGLSLALASLLWEHPLTAADIDRTLRRQGIAIDRRRLHRELAHLTRQGVLTCTDDAFVSTVHTGAFAELKFEDVFNLLSSGNAAGRMHYTSMPPMSVSSRGPGGA